MRYQTPPSLFEKPLPEDDPTFTAFNYTLFLPRQPRCFGDRLATASNPQCELFSRMARPTKVHPQVQVLRLEERRFKE